MADPSRKSRFWGRTYAIRVMWIAFGWFWGSWSVVLPSVRLATGLDYWDFGLALLAVPACAMPAMILAGRAYDRRGDAVLVLALILIAVFAPLLGAARSPGALVFMLALTGLASGTVDVALNAVTVADETRAGLGSVQAAQACFPVSGVIAGVLAGLLLQAGSGPAAVLGLASALLAAATVGVLLTRAPRILTAEHPAPLRVTRFPVLLLLGAAATGALLVENAVQQWSASRMQFELGAGPAIAALAPTGFALGLFAGRFASGVTGRFTTSSAALLLAAVSNVAGLLIAAWVPNQLLAVAGFSVAGLGLGAAAPAVFSTAGRVVPEQCRGQAVSRISSIAYTGYFVGPVLVGLSSTLGGLQAGFTGVAVVAGLLAFPALLLRNRDRAVRRAADVAHGARLNVIDLGR